MSISQRGPRKRSWRFGVLDEYYSGIPCFPATCLALRLRGPRKILIFGVPFRPQVFLAFPPPVLLLPVVWQISLPLHSTPKNRPLRRFFLHNPKYFTTFASDSVKRYLSLHILV